MTSSVNENYIIEMIKLQKLLENFKEFYLILDVDNCENEYHYLKLSNFAKTIFELSNSITQKLVKQICDKTVAQERFDKLLFIGNHLEDISNLDVNSIIARIDEKISSMEHILLHYKLIY